MKARFRKGMLMVTLPVIAPPRKSKSGKTFVVASSGGNRWTSLKVDKKHVIVNVNAYIKKADVSQREAVTSNRRKKEKGSRAERRQH